MWTLATPILFVFGWGFLKGAWQQARNGRANMDTLVTVSTLVAYLFSIFNTLFPEFWLERGLEPHVYFEASAGIITFVSIGKMLEEQAKNSTTAAITKLMGLQPKNVTRVAENGEMVSGTNQENAAYPSGLCAERVTMFYANSKYPNVAPKALAIATFAGGDFLDEPITPCGACRQVLLESEMRYGVDIDVLLFGRKGVYVVKSVKALLPLAFDKSALK
jgi:homotetrameric cytidine deaminase